MQGSYTEYILFKTFGVFRDYLIPLINQYNNRQETNEIWKHFFLSPQQIARYRAHTIKGELPFICMWPMSGLEYAQTGMGSYGRGVLNRTEYTDCCSVPPKPIVVRLMDYQRKYSIYAGSHYHDFIDRVNDNLLDLDMVRYVPISLNELLCGYQTTAEFKLDSISIQDSPDERVESRVFGLIANYTVSMTVPRLNQDPFTFDAMNLFFRDERIFSYPSVSVSMS